MRLSPVIMKYFEGNVSAQLNIMKPKNKASFLNTRNMVEIDNA